MADVFYSVRPAGAGSGNDLKVACNISISSGVATFSVAQTGDIGVGCYVTSDNVAGYISEMTDNTHAKIITATGATHANVSSEALGAIYHPYASLAEAEAGSGDASHLSTFDLTADGADVNLFWPYYGASADTTTVTINSYITDGTHKITVYTPQGGTESINNWRHAGVWDDDKASYERAGDGINSSVQNFTIDGLQLKLTNQYSTKYLLRVGAVNSGATFTVRNCIIVGDVSGTGGHVGIYLPDSDCTYYAHNNIIYGFNTGSAGSGVECSGSGGTYYIYNNIIFDCYQGIYGITANAYIKNCAVFGNTDDFNGTLTIDHCASDDGDGTNAVDISPNATEADDWAAAFTDYTNGDFSLKSGSPLIDAGTDLSAVMDSVDIIGTSRPQGDYWDIGAFEYVVKWNTIIPAKWNGIDWSNLKWNGM